MIFVSYSYSNPVTKSSGFGNELFNDTIPPSGPRDLRILKERIEEFTGASTTITILNWKMM